MAGESGAIPGEEIILGYQNELAEANHKIIVLGAHNRILQRDLGEALKDNERLRQQLVERAAERETGGSPSDQEAKE